MKMRVNHSGLNSVVKTSLEDCQALFNVIKAMEGEVNNLKNVWQGEEADIFYIKIDNYLEKMKSVPETYNTLAKFMTKANDLYKQADETFANEIDKVRNS